MSIFPKKRIKEKSCSSIDLPIVLCPFSYVFLKKAEQIIKEITPGISIRWIDKSKEPDEIRKRGNIEGCIVNAKAIKSYVLDKKDFQKEVTEALK